MTTTTTTTGLLTNRTLVKHAWKWRDANPDNWPTDRVVFARPFGRSGRVEFGFISTGGQWWSVVRLRYDEPSKQLTVRRDRRADIGRMPPGQQPDREQITYVGGE